MWGLFAGIAYWLTELSLGNAFIAGFGGVILHWLSEWLHQMGHAAVAFKLGYPMKILLFNWFLAPSLYPRDEPELPAIIHIKRALGGPAVSLILSLLGFLLWFLFVPTNELPAFLLQLFALENLIVFFIGALLPLGFTDGSTLLKWLPHLKKA